MDWKRIAPWNWFKDEEGREGAAVAPRSEVAADPFVGLRRDFERAFDHVLSRALATSPIAHGAASPIIARPSVDISEGSKGYTVRADLPGVDLEDIAIEVEGNRLAIRAEKRRESEEADEGYHCVERSYGLVQRILSLPEDADPEAIDAGFDNGVLELRIAKHAARATHPRSIEIHRG